MVHPLMGKAKPKAAPGVPDVAQLVANASAKIESEGAVKISALGPKALRTLVLSELAKHGFETTQAVVRKAVATQLELALASGAFIPLKQAAAHAPGATAPEAKRIALALVASGTARLVLRGTEEVLVPAGAEVLSRQELVRFEALAKSVAKAARSKSGASLLRADLMEAIAQALPSRERAPNARGVQNTAAPLEARASQAWQRLLSAVDATRDQQTGLSFVPAIVARLRPDLDPETAQAQLLAAANSGLLELRPEGGINRLSAEELSLCPPGPQGTRLSWARRTENVA